MSRAVTMFTRKVNLDNDTHDNHPFIICRDCSSIHFEQLRGGRKKRYTGYHSWSNKWSRARRTCCIDDSLDSILLHVKMSIGKVKLT